MNTLKRTTIFLHIGQMNELTAMAKSRGSASAAEYVRMAIDQFLRRERRAQHQDAAFVPATNGLRRTRKK